MCSNTIYNNSYMLIVWLIYSNSTNINITNLINSIVFKQKVPFFCIIRILVKKHLHTSINNPSNMGINTIYDSIHFIILPPMPNTFIIIRIDFLFTIITLIYFSIFVINICSLMINRGIVKIIYPIYIIILPRNRLSWQHFGLCS